MDLEIVCTPQGPNDEQLSAVAIAVQCQSQVTEYVYILMVLDEMTGISIRCRNSGGYIVYLGYDVLPCLLDYMGYQRRAWSEELEMNDICFGKVQDVIFVEKRDQWT